MTGRPCNGFTTTFVLIDDFCQSFEPKLKERLLADRKHRQRATRLALSEIMTILVCFHTSHFRTFKHYHFHLLANQRADFPGLVSYQRFVELMPRAILPLCAWVLACRGEVTGISFIDSTVLRVCHPKRIARNKVFADVAQIGRSSMGWFYGFKLHWVINEKGELLSFALTPGNVDDRQPVRKLARRLWGKLFGDKGYISQSLFEELYERGLKLITTVRANMKNRLLDWQEKILLRKRSLIETANDMLKNVCQIEHTRHRSVSNFVVNLLCGLAAYCQLPKKPTLRFSDQFNGTVLALP